jgi:hypothetical protein
MGGRLKQGDVRAIEVEVAENAKLSLSTIQAIKLNSRTEQCGQEINAKVAKGGLFVHAPLAVAPSSNSFYKQRRTIQLEPEASAVVVNICDASSVAQDDAWSPAFGFNSQTRFISNNSTDPAFSWRGPFLATSLFNDSKLGIATPRVQASVTAVGPRSRQVQDMLESFNSSCAGTPFDEIQMICTTEDSPNGRVTTAKIGATTIEQLIRVLHECLSPLEQELGTAPYTGAVHASSTIKAIEPASQELSNTAWQHLMWQERNCASTN